MKPIYLDHHSTTPVDPRVVERMLPFFGEDFGNAASRTHVFGWRAETAVEMARETLAAALGAKPGEIVFTSGATESNNLAILGAVDALSARGDHVVTTAIEHPSVLDPCAFLEGRGKRVTRLPVDSEGFVDPDGVADAIEDGTVLVSVMLANNEIGVVEPLAEIGRVCAERGVWLHTDATQALGRLPVDVGELGVALLSASAHKVYGPKGAGLLYVRRRPRVRLTPQLHGGGHERGLRSGTLAVPLVVGFGEAVRLAEAEREEETARVSALRDRLLARLAGELEGVRLNGHRERRLPNNLHVSFDGVDADALVADLKDLAVSTGSACSSATPEPSHVLRALGQSEGRVRGGLRMGLGRFNTAEEIERAADLLVAAVGQRRAATGAS